MRVPFRNQIGADFRVVSSLGVAAGRACGNPLAAQHCRHGRSVVIAVAALDVEEEILKRVLIWAWSLYPFVVGKGTQESLQGFDFVVGCGLAGHNLLSQLCYPR